MVNDKPRSAAKSPPTPVAPPRRTVHMWTAQCEDCFKWRKMDTQEEFEEVRSKITEEPFSCRKKAGASCSDPADLEFDPSRRTWVAHKPNAPKTPAGFKCRMVPRKNTAKSINKLDIYYDPPAGRQLRCPGEVAAFLAANQDKFSHLTPDDFSFARPKIMGEPKTPVESSVSGEIEDG